MLKTIASVLFFSIGYTITIVADVVLTPFYLVKAIKNFNKEGLK